MGTNPAIFRKQKKYTASIYISRFDYKSTESLNYNYAACSEKLEKF